MLSLKILSAIAAIALAAAARGQDQPNIVFIMADDMGYGLVFDLGGADPLGGLRVVRVNQEHGFVEAPGGAVPFDDLPIGSRVRVMPNHACMTAAAYDRYHVVDGGDGNDKLHGGPGADQLLGGDGGDDLRGEAGDDQLTDQDDNDRCNGGTGEDQIACQDVPNLPF